jgi:hypothetical protein
MPRSVGCTATEPQAEFDQGDDDSYGEEHTNADNYPGQLSKRLSVGVAVVRVPSRPLPSGSLTCGDDRKNNGEDRSDSNPQSDELLASHSCQASRLSEFGALRATMPLSAPPDHQRKEICVKDLVGAASVVCPCIAVIGLVPCSV